MNLADRFQSTTTDANNTGTSILINSSNDRGLLIKAGRKDSDREVAYFDLVSSTGGTTNMLTMGKYGSAYNAGIGTTAPAEKLDVAGNIRVTGVGNAVNLDTLGSAGSNGIKVQNNYETVVYSGRGSAGFGVFGNTNIRLGFGGATTTGNADLLINNSGQVGIGTTSPTQKLDVAGSAVFSQRLIANTNQYYIKYAVWNSASNYGIGMTNGFTYGALNNDYAMTFCMNNDTDRGFWWGYDGQSKSTGAMSLNMQGKLKVNHSIGLGTVNPSATQGRIDASNDIVAYSTSDIRLKDNIKSIDKALDKVNSIQGIEFDWIEKEEVHGNSGHDVGVIAQEIEKILPDVVTTRDNGYKAVKYEKIVPLLIEAIKDLSKQVDGLKRLI